MAFENYIGSRDSTIRNILRRKCLDICENEGFTETVFMKKWKVFWFICCNDSSYEITDSSLTHFSTYLCEDRNKIGQNSDLRRIQIRDLEQRVQWFNNFGRPWLEPTQVPPCTFVYGGIGDNGQREIHQLYIKDMHEISVYNRQNIDNDHDYDHVNNRL